jgi:hypothetical protein
MKNLMTFLKSPVGKLHSAFSLFILFNLLSGLVNLFIHYMLWLDMVHFYTGLLILAAPVVFLLVSKNRNIVLKAFFKMTLSGKADIKNGKLAAPLFKLVTLLSALLILISSLSGIFVKFQLLLPAQSFNIHVIDFKILLVLIPLHVLLGPAVRAARTKKPVKAH